MKDLLFIQACPDDQYYTWQVHLWLESLRKIGKSDQAISLIFIPKDRDKNEKWEELVKLYPESEFFFYKDTDNISKLLGFYIPLLRPYILLKYFQLHPELSEKAIFYCDCDIIFTDKFNIDKYINDDICYVSNTLSYISANYFDSKIKDVLPSKLEKYKEIDVLDEACQIVGIDRQIAVKNNDDSGGAQYLLKNIDWKFWAKVLSDCVTIRQYLQNINRLYFENENKGFQAWATDMWAVLWNLWYLERDVKIVPEMEFAWSTDSISKLDKVGILHNAGIGSEFVDKNPVFYKFKYHTGKNPFTDPHTKDVLNSEKTKTLCNWYYTNKLMELNNINYF